MSKLTDEEVRFYHENGYFLYHKPLFDDATFGRLSNLFEELLANRGNKRSDELDTPHFEEPRLMEFLLHDDVLDLVEPIIGPNIGLWSSHFISKEPFTGRATPWHEDSAYWKGRMTAYDKIVTVWLAIDESTRDNGCMRVIPGTHRNGFSDYEGVDSGVNTFNTQIKDVDESKAVYFELKPGECSLHDSRIIHGAAANTSPKRRCGYTMRYFSTELRVIPENNPGMRVWLARGTDVYGSNPFENR